MCVCVYACIRFDLIAERCSCCGTSGMANKIPAGSSRNIFQDAVNDRRSIACQVFNASSPRCPHSQVTSLTALTALQLAVSASPWKL